MSREQSRPLAPQLPSKPNAAGSPTPLPKSEPEYQTAQGCLLLIGIGVLAMILMALATIFLGDFT